MIDFDSEIKKFEKVAQTSDIENLVYDEDMEDVSDIVREVLKARNTVR